MRKKLNLGSGKQYYKGYVNLDIDPATNPDILFDLNYFPYPFENNEFDYILADNILEHLNDLVKVMEELYRILKPGGKLYIIVPYFKHDSAWGEPTHRRAFSESTFRYFAKNFNMENNPVKLQFTNGKIFYGCTGLGSTLFPITKLLRYFTDLMILNLEIELIK